MSKRSTIGINPLDAVIPVISTPQDESVIDEAPVERSTRVAKERLTIHLPVSLIDRVKNTVYWTPGLTLAGLAERALEQAVNELEAENGQPFKPRREELKGGRPLK